MDGLKKTIQINPDFLKLSMKGGRSRKNTGPSAPKPIKIRTEKPGNDKTIKRRAINYIRKQQEDRYKRLLKGVDDSTNSVSDIRVETTDPKKTYADEFKSDFDDSLSFLQKLADQNSQKVALNQTLKQYPTSPNSTLFHTPILNAVLDENVSLVEPDDALRAFPTPNNMGTSFTPSISIPVSPTYGCLKGGRLPTYRTFKNNPPPPQYVGGQSAANANVGQPIPHTNISQSVANANVGQSAGGRQNSLSKLTPEQQRSELKHFLNQRKEEKLRIERVKKQRNLLKPNKKQKRTTTRTFRVGKSKHYPHIGVLIPNKTIRNQVLAKKQQIRECAIEDVRKYLIKKGLIRVGSSCPNDVLRKMYESSMLMCGEIQNHNPDNLLYNYLHNAI